MEIDCFKSSERKIRIILGAVDELEDYLVYRSEKFPFYYGGNGVELRSPMDLKQAENVYDHYFSKDIYKHTTISFFDTGLPFEKILSKAKKDHYYIEKGSVMGIAKALPICSPSSFNYEITDIGDDRLFEIFQHENSGQSWWKGGAGQKLWKKAEYLHRNVTSSLD